MIYFTLPEFYFNFNILNTFNKLPKEYFKTEIAFSTTEGNFPYSYWNGGFNNNMGKLALYIEMVNCIEKNNYNIRFNCSNIYLTENDFSNTLGNLILSLGESGCNSILISNLKLYEILKEKFPNYSFVFSRDANLIHPVDENIINIIADNDDFELIQLPQDKIFDFNFLTNIKNRKKIEICVNSLCDIEQCKNCKECQYIAHQNQYNYSGVNNYLACAKRPPYHYKKPLLSIEDLLKDYVPLGINHFSLAPIFHSQKDNFLLFLIEYFIKDEYKFEVKKILESWTL